nr:cytochrome P450 [Streptomyces sp. HNM0574]
MTTLRALALLAAHPGQAALAHGEAVPRGGGPRELPLLRAAALETLRLFPTTPLLLRESTAGTVWHGERVPPGTVFLLYAPYLHRAGPGAAYGDVFAPAHWTGGAAPGDPALVPFGAGPAGCPGENLVLLTVSCVLAALLRGHSHRLTSHPALNPLLPVPAALDPFALRFRVTPHADAGR